MSLRALNAAVAAVCPIHGVNTDRVISFKDEATPEQRAAAQAVAQDFDLNAPEVPAEVTRRQARQALLLAGLLDQVQPAIDAIPDEQQRALMQIEWEDSQTFQRNRPALVSLASALGLSDAQLDALFTTAATL